MLSRSFVLATALVLAVGSACVVERAPTGAKIGYEGRVARILDLQCLRCHAGPAPAGGWRAGSWLDAIACTSAGTPVTEPPAPLLSVLDRADHAGVITADERTTLAAWIADGASRAGTNGVHDPGFADPRSPASHGRALRARRWASMLDRDDPDACAACHDGVLGSRTAPRRDVIASGAAKAPACTTCHAGADGPLACSTCHGQGERAFPPRDRCFFPDDPEDHAHAAHASTSASRSAGLACGTCHPSPATGDFGGPHTDGYVEVWFDGVVAGNAASFDPSTRTCQSTCHARGGKRPGPAWNEGPMGCGDCHGAPPASHYPGACTTCHREANALGTALMTPVLHMNGRVDLGDGSGTCGACHGNAADPSPASGAHKAHTSPKSAAPVACESCHVVPDGTTRHPLGVDVSVRFAGLATRGGNRPAYDPATKTCSGTYCHAGSGGSTPNPRWTDGASAATCDACHGVPPAPPHAQATTCGGSSCHEGRVLGGDLTPGARMAHVNGGIDRAL